MEGNSTTASVVALDAIKINPNNPREISAGDFEALKDSILSFPKMLSLRPVVVDDNGVILGGNMRAAALAEIAQMPDDVIAARLNNMRTIQRAPDGRLRDVLDYWHNWKGAPCVSVARAADLTPDEIEQFIITDNNGFGRWDWDALAMGDWQDAPLDEWGLSWTDESDRAADDATTEPDAPMEEDNFNEDADDVPARVSAGDVWLLAEHRLMCGDSTNYDDLNKLMGGVMADLVFTDPPYGMGKECDGVANDNLYGDKLLAFNRAWIPLSFAFLKDNGSWYCWGNDEPLMDIYAFILKPMIKENKITFRNLLTWNKGMCQGVLSPLHRMYPNATEKCLFVMCGVQEMSTNTDNYFEGWDSIRLYLKGEADKVGLTNAKLKEICGVGMYSHWFTKSQWQLIPPHHYRKLQEAYNADAFKKDYDALKKDYDALKKDYDALKKDYDAHRAYFNNTHEKMTNVWTYENTQMGAEAYKEAKEERASCGGHATPKPLTLCRRGIKTSTPDEGAVVLDLFGGSGSTLIACEQLNRKCYTMELTPHYCDAIIARWEKLTGKKAIKEELINDGKQ